MDRNEWLARVFGQADEQLAQLEEGLREEAPLPLDPALRQTTAVVRRLLAGYAAHAGKEMPPSDDLLDVLRAFLKGDPSLHAVRDNVRELVYYRNCLDMDREDALPKAAEKMAVRTARHIYLYLRSRSEQEGRLDS
jgi:hypothetical protein